MARWHGIIGFAETIETAPGVWEEQIVDKEYYGDVLRASIRSQNSNNINNDINISNQISIIANPYASQKCHNIRYVTFMGAKWNVTDVNIDEYPRISLTVGGVYTGEPHTNYE